MRTIVGVAFGFVLACVSATRADVILGTVAGHVTHSVPNPNYDPNQPIGPNNQQCITVDYGEIGGRLGRRDGGSMGMSGAFRKTYTGADCCPRLDVLNLVIGDTSPPYWVDPQGNVHRIDEVTGPDGLYVDPLSGGNGHGVQDPTGADRNPGYDGVQRTRTDGTARHASDAGNGVAGYGLNDINMNNVDWRNDPAVDFTFTDSPSPVAQGGVLEFVTMVVCIDDAEHEICPVGGFAWGQRADGTQHIDGPFSGTNYPGGMTTANITAGLARSGFGAYTMVDSCCPCPAPSAGAVFAAACTVVLRRRARAASAPVAA
jgi:hypothetical protein